MHHGGANNKHAHFQECFGHELEFWVWNKEPKRWEEKPQLRSCLTKNFLECNPQVALKLQWSLMCWHEHHDASGVHLASVSTLKGRSIQLDRKSLWGIAKRIEESLEREVTKLIEEGGTKEKTKEATSNHRKSKAYELL